MKLSISIAMILLILAGPTYGQRQPTLELKKYSFWSSSRLIRSWCESPRVRGLDVRRTGVVDFFATCTIPLEQWFDPDTQKYLSDLVKHKYENNLRQNRVLMFKREIDLLP
jgi:hypothetical protein